MLQKNNIFFVRVYYEDTDTAGIVYYANYLKFAERARTELLRAAGIEQTDLLENHKIGFVVRKCEANFLQPASLDDLLTVKTSIVDMNRASLTMQQNIFCGEDLLVKLEVKIAVVGEGMKPTRLPDFIRAALSD